MSDKKSNTTERLIEIGKALGGIFAVLFVAMDARVRPFVTEAMQFAESMGIRGTRLVRQIVDRHLVAMFLRPLLIVSTAVVTIVYGLGVYWTSVVGVGFTELHGFGWLAFIAGLATLVPLGIIIRVWEVRGVRDAGLRTERRALMQQSLQASLRSAGVIRQAIEGSISRTTDELASGPPAQTVATLNLIVTELREFEIEMTEIERLLQAGESPQALMRLTQLEARLTAALQRIGPYLATPAVQADARSRVLTTAHQGELEGLQVQVTALRTTITRASAPNVRDLQSHINGRFGPPGYTPYIAVVLILQWVIAAAWFVAIGVILRSSHLGAMEVDHRWTSGFVLMGVVLGFGAIGWVVLALAVAKFVVNYALRFLLWPLRFVAFSAVEIFDFDDKNDELRIEKNFGIPLDQWSNALGSAMGTPLGVYAGLMMLLITGHSIDQLALIVMDAFVLLLGYLFLVKMAGIKNEWIYRGVIIFHFVWAVGQFLVWAFRPSMGMEDALVIGLAAYVLANVVTPTFVVVMMVITGVVGWFATKTDGTVRRLLLVAATAMAILTAGTVLARTAFAAPPASVVTAIEESDNGLGDLMPERTVNAGSHDANDRATCFSTSPHTTRCDTH